MCEFPSRKLRYELFEKLGKFLDTPVEGNGSWPEVSDDDLEQLYDIIRNVIDLKFERDCDGDSVINFRLANRNEEFFPMGAVGYNDEKSYLIGATTFLNLFRDEYEKRNFYKNDDTE